MSSYTKTFALCDNVDIRVHCTFVELNTSNGHDYDEEYDDIELVIGNQVVKLEGEILDDIYENIIYAVSNIDCPDHCHEDEEQPEAVIYLGKELSE